MDEEDYQNKLEEEQDKFIGGSIIGFIIAALVIGVIISFFKYIFFTSFYSVKYIGDITLFKIIILLFIVGVIFSIIAESKDKKKQKYNKKKKKKKEE